MTLVFTEENMRLGWLMATGMLIEYVKLPEKPKEKQDEPTVDYR